MMLTAWIDGVGLLAPGIVDWSNGCEILTGRQAHHTAPTVLTAPAVLPPAERRRASRLVKAALSVGFAAVSDAGADARTLATVFTSSSGDGHNCHALCETLASADRQVSPTRFHNSVHNAAAGYWGIATGAMAPSQVLCAYDASFAAGLLEALAQASSAHKSILLIAYDAEYPEPIHAARPVPDAAGVALLISPVAGPRSLAKLAVDFGETASTRMREPSVETLRADIPALRGLPLLDLLARRTAGVVCLDYLAQLQLRVEVTPC